MPETTKKVDPIAQLDAAARADFYTFVKKVFQLVAPGEEFIANWHIRKRLLALRSRANVGS